MAEQCFRTEEELKQYLGLAPDDKIDWHYLTAVCTICNKEAHRVATAKTSSDKYPTASLYDCGYIYIAGAFHKTEEDMLKAIEPNPTIYAP